MSVALFAADQPVDFNRDVRPLLSDRCYGCHGPDADKGRKAGLRLDEPEGATKKLKSGERAVVPGRPRAERDDQTHPLGRPGRRDASAGAPPAVDRRRKRHPDPLW